MIGDRKTVPGKQGTGNREQETGNRKQGKRVEEESRPR
jgi:hypothetical protein